MNSVSLRTSEEIAARAVSIEVKQGMRFSVAARRMWKPSRSVSVTRPSGVLITQSTMPSLDHVDDVGVALVEALR